jgi:transcriptional regulator with XRE-family HTH domain
MNTVINVMMSKRLRELREKFGYTQEKLAELSGIEYKHIQLLESKDPPAATLVTLERLAKAFKMTPSKLLDF